MTHRKNETPGWLPFAILGSFVVMVAAGIKSNWKAAPTAGTPPPPPPIKKAGVLQDWVTGDYRL